jgi:hypothetical protein
MLTRVHIIG